MSELKNTKIRFWGGLRTIGGTIVSIEYHNARVIFDFGMIFSPATSIFDGTIQQRVHRNVHDHVKLGMVPPIDGIYEQADITGMDGVVPYEQDRRDTAVFVSHLHLDHMGGIGMLSPKLPIYMTKESVELYHAVETVGETVPGHAPNLRTCEYDQPIQIGDIRIMPIQMDHDVIGACGFHIETPDGAIFYTGDFRLHGNHPELIEEAIDKVKRLGFDAVIMEGTTLRSIEEDRSLIVPDNTIPDSLIKESQVTTQMQEILKDTKGLGLFNFYHRNVERLSKIIELGKEIGRTVVFEPETAYIAHRFLTTKDFSIYMSAEMNAAITAGTLHSWQRELLEAYEQVDADEINKQPSSYLLQNSYEHAMELFDLNVEDGVYLHSNGMPLGDYDPAYHNLMKFLKLVKLKRYYVGTGGHAIPQHLKYVMEKLDPSIVIPLHSFNPERLVPDHGRLLMPEYGVTYLLNKHSLYKS